MVTNYEGNRPQDAAKDEAARVADHAKGAAQDVAGSATREARQVAGEATDQIRSLVSSARDEAYVQAAGQQEKLAGQSRIVSDDLQRLSRGERPQSDLVNQGLSIVSQRVEEFTTRLESKEPAELVQDVRRFAARRPLAFLAAAAGIGLVAGRLTRGLSDGDDEHSAAGQYRIPSAPGAYGPPSTNPTPAVADGGPGFDETPEFTATGQHFGRLPGEDVPDVDPARDPFTGFEHPEDRR